MKSTGIVRKVDQLGRIVIPKELRDTLGIDQKSPLEIFTSEDTIILGKYEPKCTICGNSKGTRKFKEKLICNNCIAYIKEAGR
jgi:transcriptional pleiotropic regulator of transition state genes